MAGDSFAPSGSSMSARRTPETDDTSINSSSELGLLLQKTLPETLGRQLHELYSDNITAKVFRASVDCLRNNVSFGRLLQVEDRITKSSPSIPSRPTRNMFRKPARAPACM